MISPPAKLRPLSESDRLAILAENDGSEWQEKIRKFASLAGRSLRGVAKQRFGDEAANHLEWFFAVLRQRPSIGTVPVDHAYLSAMLYCHDALRGPGKYSWATDLDTLYFSLKDLPPVTPQSGAMGSLFSGDAGNWKSESSARGIVLICPSPASLMALSVFDILQKLGTPIEAVVLRKFSLSRVRQEVARDGVGRIARKVWRKLILRADENPEKTETSLKAVHERLGAKGDIRSAASAASIPLIEVDDLNDAVGPLSKLSPRLAIFTGGGLIGRPLLDVFEAGILNVHMGSLPQHKGMDVVEAAILEANFEHVALTSHLMVPQLDAGPVIATYRLNSDGYRTHGALRNELSAIMPLIAVDSILGYLSGRLKAEQQPDAGRQYYFTHPELLKIITRVLKERHNPALESHPARIVNETFMTAGL